MKNFTLMIGLLFVMNAQADIEYSADQDSRPSTEEISSNRACFEEVARLGCGDPGEDSSHFQTCLKESSPKLTAKCKTMMKELYGIQ